jgi:hypothetical protein
MSTTIPAAASAQPAQQSSGRGRVLRLVFGSLGLLAALAFIGGAGALTWALGTQRDGSGYFTTSTHHYQTLSYALSSESLDVSGLKGTLEAGLARLRLTVTSADAAKPLFVGIAPASDVERYLARVQHDELGDLELDPFKVEYRPQGGGAPAALPATQSFWRAKATGTGTQTISWPVEKGHWSAVVMNADGRPTVSVDAQIAAHAAYIWSIVVALFVLGGLSLLGGAVLVWRGVR